MTFAVRENATVFLDDKDPGRAEMQLNHLVGLIGERKLFLILFKWPDGLSTSEFAEPEDNFIQTTGTQQGLTVELMRDGKLSVIGHPNGERGMVHLARQDGTGLEVEKNEVLSPQEVSNLLTEYFKTEAIDTTTWSLREIPLESDDGPDISASGPSAGAPSAPTTSSVPVARDRDIPNQAGAGGTAPVNPTEAP